MNDKIFNSEKLYISTMTIAKSMLDKKLITPEEYKKFDKEMIKKYNPIISMLISSNP